jgi:hypothetical protein
MTSGGSAIKTLTDFFILEIPAKAPAARCTLRRLEAPASSAVVELGTRLVGMQK